MDENQALLASLSEIDRKHVLHPSTNPKTHFENGPKIIFQDGNGIYLRDLEGREYIDGVSMLWNVNLGHGIKEIAQAACDQMKKAAYTTTFYGYTNEATTRLAEKIISLAPGDLTSIFFTSGGSESNDSAFKFSRFYWALKGKKKKRKIISLRRGYHGVTVATSLATGIDAYREFTGEPSPEILTAIPHATECERGDRSHPDYDRSIRGMIEKEGADTVAAVILEPIQGAGGVHVPPDDYLLAVRDLCDEFNIHFIADEVITGFGRTGKMFGVEQWEVVPDFMCIAKGVTSGYAQLGGVIMSKEIRDTFVQVDDMFAHGFTYSGHAMACAVGLKNIEILERDGLIENSRERGIELLAGIKQLEDKYRFLTNSRGRGLLVGFDLMEDPATNTPFDKQTQAAAKVVEEAYKNDLLIRSFDFEAGMNVVAVSPPLIVKREEVGDILNRLDNALRAFSKIL